MTPRRKPLQSVSVNINARKVQLSLDNFLSHPNKPKPIKEGTKSAKEDKKPFKVEDDDGLFSNDDEVIDISDDYDSDTPLPKKRQKIIVSECKTQPRKVQTQRKFNVTSNRGPRQAADQSDLPPISSIPAMFDDMVSHAPELGKVVDRLNGRKLRVATMCSGTESPLLALRMITRSLFKETGKKLEVEHIFSCEIEPFKQAYIERNFAPPILFRDVLELSNDYAYVSC